MLTPFSAARLRLSASFRRLTGVGACTFDRMVKELCGPWEAAQRDLVLSARESRLEPV